MAVTIGWYKKFFRADQKEGKIQMVRPQNYAWPSSGGKYFKRPYVAFFIPISMIPQVSYNCIDAFFLRRTEHM